MTRPPSSGVRLLEIRTKSGYCNLTQVKCYVLAENETLPSLLSIYIFWPCPSNVRGNYLEYVENKRKKSRHLNKKYKITKLRKLKAWECPKPQFRLPGTSTTVLVY